MNHNNKVNRKTIVFIKRKSDQNVVFLLTRVSLSPPPDPGNTQSLCDPATERYRWRNFPIGRACPGQRLWCGNCVGVWVGGRAVGRMRAE